MAEHDLVIRNTTIATAADVVKGDIGISTGRVVALGERLDKGKKEIDVAGLIAVPVGIDAHVPFDRASVTGPMFWQGRCSAGTCARDTLIGRSLLV